jgi:nicotinamide mononucleotide adenylyltransferase
LPRGRNRSLKDKSYNEKRSVYATENISGQTLAESYFQNNPTVKTAFESLGLEIRTPEKFNKSEIESRKEFYKKIAKKIWNNSAIIDA